MARKGNQQKNGLDRHSSNHRKGVLDSASSLPIANERKKTSPKKIATEEELPNGCLPNVPLTEIMNNSMHVADDKKSRKRSGKVPGRNDQSMDVRWGMSETMPRGRSASGCSPNVQISSSREENGPTPDSNQSSNNSNISYAQLANGLRRGDKVENVHLADTLVFRRLSTLALCILEASYEWIEKQKPLVNTLATNVLNARDYVLLKVKLAYPIVLRWFMHFGGIVLLLSMVWLDCAFKGIDSLVRMGTTSYFAVLWCCVLSTISMIGMFKLLIVLAAAALMGFFLGITIAVLLIAISGVGILWFYGSFWTTGAVIFFGGVAFTLSHERLAMFITTVYSIYCAWTYAGWLGLLLGLNLSFISSDILIIFLKNNMNVHRRPEQTAGMQAQPGFYPGEAMPTPPSESSPGQPSDCGQGVPSISGFDSEETSEEEVLRLLNCTDHYSALGLSRFENVDVSVLKREYRKKAMLVHPDKNMGNEQAADAFKKLQSAYEVLLDSFKRKAYDDELQREELLNYFCRFQSASQNRKHGIFASRHGGTEVDGEEPAGELRRMACRKCNSFHVWIHTRKTKSRARWCQDCKEFHQAKDGEGWVEQSTKPLFFGMLQRVDAPCAYVCADSNIYDATEWYICQGMRCPVNTHKPSFHVNASVTKPNNGKASGSGKRSGGMPTSNMEETMTEEEFFEWLQNAVQAGGFDNFARSTSESPSGRAGTSSKSGGSNNSSGKKKKKGKKPW